MKRPSMRGLPLPLANAARGLAEALRSAGHRAWLVGGAVRDLALGVAPGDIDLASAARPDELERLFPATHAVGRAFGTVVVRFEELDVQVTTFRAEAGYDDARRPTHVRFGASLEEDAARRDFTCNALYLDPLDDELADPTGGLADLAARRLRCVGEASARFAEDGLRLLRLARLAAQLGLEIEAGTREGARRSLDSLRGVSPERVLGELGRMAGGPAPALAVGCLHELGVLERLPGFRRLEGEPPSLAQRVEALARLDGAGVPRVLGTLFRPSSALRHDATLEALSELRPSRAVLQRVGEVLELEPSLEACLADLARVSERRSRWVRVVRAEEFGDALAVWSAWHPGVHEAARATLSRRAAELPREELWPAPLVTSAELARSGVPRGPRWGELLRAAEDAQLDGELRTLEQAAAWLEHHARR